MPAGWPLCLSKNGVIVHLGQLSSTLIRNKDCYICLKSKSSPGLEVTLFWRLAGEIHSRTIVNFEYLQNSEPTMCSTLATNLDLEFPSADEVEAVELPELLQNLLVSIEHAIERVPLDDLTFPCPECFQYLPLERQETVECAACSCSCSCRISTENGCVQKKDTSIQTSPMFEFAGSIPHIDSDEDDDKDSIKSGMCIFVLLEGGHSVIHGTVF